MNSLNFFLMRTTPWQLRELARRIVDAPARAKFRKRLAAVSWDGEKALCGLGGALDEGPPRGGRVKLLHLRERFGDAEAGFRILYLVSSALPKFWKETLDWASAKGARLVWNQNGVAYRGWAGAEYPRWNRPMQEGLQRADYVIYQSQFCRRSAEKFLGVSTAPSVVLLNPVDTSIFFPAENMRLDGTIRLLVIGTHASRQRVRLAVDTLSILRREGFKARLSVIGPLGWPSADEQLRNWVAYHSLGEFIRIEGAFSQAEAPAIYRSHDILLHLKPMDPCPTVVAEAMSCGLPVIGPANGGLPEMVGELGGGLIPSTDNYDNEPPLNPEEVAMTVRKVASLLTGLSDLVRKRALKLFSSDAWLEAHDKIFRKVLHEDT